ncbi:MAG TPA: aconitase X catalytic domain-containing protein [Actinomycetota bacterium]
MPLELDDADRAMLAGDEGEAAAMAMRIVAETAEAMRAPRLLDVSRAHVDGCLYHGRAGLDFAERLAAAGGRTRVPTTLNVASLDLLHPGLVRLDAETATLARRLMDAYVAIGCRPTWTCAPYQLEDPPAFGEQIAWAESNAIVFANSVLGARTERYGDFIDVCCAITGRAPAVGLHTDEGRRAVLLVRVRGASEELLRSSAGLAALGHLVGAAADHGVPAIDGLPPGVSRDGLKALGAAAASSGAVAMVHVVGSTPEAPSVEAASGGAAPGRVVEVGPADLRRARDELSTHAAGTIAAVALGTPHASAEELDRIAALLADGPRPVVPCSVNTARGVLAETSGRTLDTLRDAGVTVVTDTCTYLTPILGGLAGPVMTDSAKWAWYAPANLGYGTVFGTTEECLRSAAAGRVVRDERLWGEA